MKALEVRYFDVVKRGMPTKFTLTGRDAVLWKINKLPHAMDFLKTIPIEELNQNMGRGRLDMYFNIGWVSLFSWKVALVLVVIAIWTFLVIMPSIVPMRLVQNLDMI